MSETIKRVSVTIVIETTYSNEDTVTVEAAEYETLDAFKARVDNVINVRVERAGGWVLRE